MKIVWSIRWELPYGPPLNCNRGTSKYLQTFNTYIAHLRQECHNSKFGIFGIIGTERDFADALLNRYSVITHFAKLAAGEQLCRLCTHRKL